MTKQKLHRELIGCWVLKANPNTWDYRAALEDEGVGPNQKYPSDWTLGTTYRNDLMVPGDLMILLVTGKDEPGVYEIGKLTSQAFGSDGMSLDYAVDEQAARRARVAIEYEAVVLKSPVPRAALKEDPALSESEPLRIPIISNPSYLTPDEVATLGQLLVGHVTKAAARSVGWGPLLA